MGEPGPRADFANPALSIIGLGSLPLTARHDLLLDRQAAALGSLSVLATNCRPRSPGLFGEAALDQAAKHQVIEG
jgi:hypothetical protein